jgi:4-amino-4-deoxy-L-arabinose transferase-like glycosyltransferase
VLPLLEARFDRDLAIVTNLPLACKPARRGQPGCDGPGVRSQGDNARIAGVNLSVRTRPGGAPTLLVVVVCLFLLLLLPRMIAADMFLDGLTYASMARNMAEGRGTFWKPHYTETVYPEFYESPPLGIWLQSLAFRVFGDSTLVEFLWGVGCGAIVLWLLLLTWRDLRAGPAGAWWAMLLFLACPGVSAILTNNRLEDTMACFTMLGFWLAVRAGRASSGGREAAFAAAAGAAVALGMLTKGLPAAFPFAVPAAAAVFLRSGAKRALRTTGVMLLGSGAVLAVFMVLGGSDAWHWAETYFTEQVARSLTGQREVSTSRLSLVRKLGNELAVPVVLVLLFGVAVRRVRRGDQSPSSAGPGQVAFLLTSALLATLPLLISPKQSGGYLFPSLPLWGMALAAAFPAGALRVESWLQVDLRRGARLRAVFLGAAAVMVVASFAFRGAMVFRATDLYRDVEAGRALLPPGQVVSASPAAVASDWYAVAYMQRFFEISLTAEPGRPLRLVDLRAEPRPLPPCRMLNQHPPRRYWVGDCGGSP